MGLQINDLIVENTLSASTLTATTLYVGTNSVGGTVSNFNSFSATTLSGGTIYSGNTNLYSIFATNASVVSTYVQPGSNILTGGSATSPIISLVSSPSVNNITFSGAAIGGNIQAGAGTFTSVSAATMSAGTLYSGSTNLYSIFLTTADGNDITRVQPGSNITTGGTGNLPTVSIVASPSFNSITSSGASSFTTLSATTLISGSTNLYSIFAAAGSTGGVTNVNAGSNITTGGTVISPIINLAASPSVNNITFSGTAIGGTVQAGAGTFTSLSAGTLSGGTILSGSTNLYQIFAQTGSTLIHKSGNVSGSTFAGNPKKATVTFTTAFANTNYAITISSDTNRTFTWESKSAGSFVINSNANTTFNAGNVNWTATEYGEK